MHNEEIEKIKKEYEHLKMVRKEIIDLEKQIKECEQNPIVRHYFELKEMLESDKSYEYYQTVNFNADQLLLYVINNNKITNTNNIYVYMGTYRMNWDRNGECFEDFVVSFDDINADYSEYFNIELGVSDYNKKKLVSPIRREEFEKNNIVLYPPNGVDKYDYYNSVKIMYFDTAIKCGCDKALEKVLYKRNMQRSFQNKDNK